ncbi:unnamed protein product [Didymodactylos carnosus]|uniref:Uncharacterized protein n=1 Tax=Didymodactylos carnosus TaxID=1234261 RepID=A0A814L581_9BILA|nr:unnamed protein product [Didymodactylos carnosus]CAF3827290.1 unnamed protein product [Didymodactylos carnosus]
MLESANLANRLIHGQVTNAQNAEELYQLKRENCNLKKQCDELKQIPLVYRSQQSLPLSVPTGNNIHELTAPYQQSDFLSLPIPTITNISKSDQSDDELKYYRLKESEMNIELKLLQESVKKLNDENRRLQETPQIEIASLQEELTLVKMRDAEANVNMNELKQRIADLNREWQIHDQKCKSIFNKQEQISNPQEYDLIEHELLTLKMREAQTDCENKLLSQKIMDSETQKQVAYNQIKRQDDEIQRVKLELQEHQTRESELRSQITDIKHQMRDLEIKQKEDSMMIKIRDAESTQMIGDLRQKIAELEVQNQELVTTGQLSDDRDLQDKLNELQEELEKSRITRSLSLPYMRRTSLAYLSNIKTQSINEIDNDDIMNLRLKNGSSSALYRRYSASNYQNDYEDSGDEDHDDLFSSTINATAIHPNLSILSPKCLHSSSSLKSTTSITSLKTNEIRLPSQSNLDKTENTSSFVLNVKPDHLNTRSSSAYQDDFNRNSDLDDSAPSVTSSTTNEIISSRQM